MALDHWLSHLIFEWTTDSFPICDLPRALKEWKNESDFNRELKSFVYASVYMCKL